MPLFASLLFSAALMAPLPMVARPVAAPITESAVLEAPTRHIRTTDASIKKLLKRGFRGSYSFAALVKRIQRSDVYVYVEEVDRLPNGLEGRMMMLPRAHDHRYVRIQISLRGESEDAVALLAHELQHAVEVAEAMEVFDQDGLAKLYQRIGVRGGEHLYDTLAAQQMGRTVRRELHATS
jgi:hypothetical protein